MTDWEKIRSYRESPEIQRSIEVANEMVDQVLRDGFKNDAPEEFLEGIRGLRPQGHDIPYAILEHIPNDYRFVGMATLILREDDEAITGYLGIHLITDVPRSRKERRKRTELAVEAALLLAKVALTEFKLPRVFLYVAPTQVLYAKMLRKDGFVQTGSRIVPNAKRSTLLVYEKKPN